MALDAIVERKRADVAQRMRERPLAGFQRDAHPSDRSLYDALSRERCGFVLECKKASPSKGVIRPNFDPAAIARSYAPFADAVSVLTDEPFFEGSLDYLPIVRREVPCPVLCKDFVVDPYQIYDARWSGADAILLMCSVLDQETLERCLQVCHNLAMDALVEVHDEEELDRALATDSKIIGVNNRNLQTLAVDLHTAERLCPKVPPDRIAICESGISTHEDVQRLRGICDAFLIGGHLMAAPNLDRAIRELVFGRTKICGLTNIADAKAAHAAGTVFGGVVLWPQSKRAITVAEAHAMCHEVPLAWVGVFVDEAPEVVGQAARELGLHAAQLHGDEDGATIAATRHALPGGCELWKAIRVGPGRPIASATDLGVDRVVVDRYVPGEPGGTGQAFDWSLFEAHETHREMLLSGGITPDTAAAAAALGGYGIDLSSGVEASPGKKDPAKLSALFAALRGRGRLRDAHVG